MHIYYDVHGLFYPIRCQPKVGTLLAALTKYLDNLSDRPIMTIFDVDAIMELGTNHGIDIER